MASLNEAAARWKPPWPLLAQHSVIGESPEFVPNAASSDTFKVSIKTILPRRAPLASSSSVRSLEKSDVFYSPGAKEELSREVDVDNGNAGKIENPSLKPG